MATAWADDPELLDTFRAEVEERVASLSAGLLQLESHPAPRQLVAALFRDAHTIKGSARMLGLHDVLQLAHRCEDVLGAVRDGRLPVRGDLVDVLLAACDGMLSALPGLEEPVSADHLATLAGALERILSGEVVALASAAPASHHDDADDNLRHKSESVRIAADKVYDLLDVVGEAELDARRVDRAGGVIDSLTSEQARWLRELRESVPSSTLNPEAAVALNRMLAVGDQLSAAARELRELVDGAHGRLAQVRDGALGLAMVPVRRVVAGLPRVVRDVAAKSGKDVHLELVGVDVELDKQVLDGVSDALKHLVVNAVDHGCETPTDRLAAGKLAQATVTVTARAAGGTVVIEVTDDGAGVDDERLRATAISRGLLPADSTITGPALWQLLFLPAFSTATRITETSGRGVGLDVVRESVETLGGAVDMTSQCGVGTTFVLSLPVTLGVLHCLIARIGSERYALPVPGIVESLSLRGADVHMLAGNPVVVRHGATLPLLDLGAALGVPGEREATSAVVVRHADRQVAWAVDRLEGELELVVKDLGPFLGRLPLISGATIDGDGSVVCLVDLRELSGSPSLATSTTAAEPAPETSRKPRVLIVEDSVGVRELERVILETAGYDVITAIDGLDGAAKLKGEPVDLVLTDVEMPGMDGFQLTRAIRRTKGWEHIPVVVMTSRGSDDDQRAGLDAGASAYLLKAQFDQNQLVETVRRLLGH